MRLTMVGTGYVGLVTGTCFAEMGNDVVCLDVDERKIRTLENGGCPIYEPGLTEMIRRNVEAGRLSFTMDKKKAYRDAEMVFICVGTPPDEDGTADLKYVLAAADDIGEVIKELGSGAPSKVVVVKSTVPVGSTMKVKERIRAKVGDLPFHVADNPEFLKEGAAIVDFMKPDRVVCGVENEHTAGVMEELYEPFVRQGHPIFVMDVASAEMVKYASNAMLATKISFVNEIANLCEHYGADVKRVREGMCSDSRIGDKFLYPGLGYGGSCFPKDVQACMMMGDRVGHPSPLLKAVHVVNEKQRENFFRKLVTHFGEGGMKGRKLGFWGIAFKPQTDDIREAPALTLMERALAQGAQVVAYDPVANANAKEKMGDRITLVDHPDDAIKGVDAVVICTDWSEFKSPDFEKMRTLMKSPVIFDGRNLYRKDPVSKAGFTYYSVGRPVVHPA